MHGNKGDTAVKNRLLDTVGEGEGRVIWENSTEASIWAYVRQMTHTSWTHKAGHPKPVLGVGLEARDGKEGGRGVQYGGKHVPVADSHWL